MPRIDFEQLPGSSRLWVFGVDRDLSTDEQRILLDEVDAFLGSWTAHGTPLAAAREWKYGRFLLVGVDEASVPPSGCSVDALVKVLKELEERLEVTIVDNAPVWYREGEGIQRISRERFRVLAADGSIRPETVVFDQSVTRLSQLRDGEWEKPASRSWHGRAFSWSSQA
jgi:hypothetical protein